MKRRARAPLVASLLASLLVAASTSAAQPTKLLQGVVTPSAGTTATIFQFSVHFQSGTETASSVRASVAGTSVLLSLSSGTPANGTWTGSSSLPAGSWTVTYQSTSSGATNPTFVVPTPVTVTAPTLAPTPGPVPTPRPVPTATPRPATTPVPSALATPFGTTVIDPTGSPGGSEPAPSGSDSLASTSPSASPAATVPPPPSRPLRVPVEGVVAIGLLGAVAAAAALGERRRRRAVEAFRLAAESGGTPFDGPVPGGQSPAEGWEDDETVGSIEYETPDHLREASDELASDTTDEAGR
jgi:hypothetical protein